MAPNKSKPEIIRNLVARLQRTKPVPPDKVERWSNGQAKDMLTRLEEELAPLGGMERAAADLKFYTEHRGTVQEILRLRALKEADDAMRHHEQMRRDVHARRRAIEERQRQADEQQRAADEQQRQAALDETYTKGGF